jgi:8-oxo-dGTP pyrophosphatase MutT (NUDIX family)
MVDVGPHGGRVLMSDLPVRDIARALVFDPRERLLLIAYKAARDVDPARPGLRRFWFLPGGGVEPGEKHEDALRRELEEEIGVLDVLLGPWIGVCEGPFLLFRKPRFARERYMSVRLPDERIDTARLAETEDNPVLDVRWWSVADLSSTGDVVEPQGLAVLAKRILQGDHPKQPVALSWSVAASSGA